MRAVLFANATAATLVARLASSWRSHARLVPWRPLRLLSISLPKSAITAASPDGTLTVERLKTDLMKSLSRAPEPEPADEEVMDLIPTDQNIFGLQDISAEEEAAGLPVEGEDLPPEELEAAIEAELGTAQDA